MNGGTMPKLPDEVLSTHVFHKGTASEFKDFMKRHRQDVVHIEPASDRVMVTIRTVPQDDTVVFVSGVYPQGVKG